jgi:endonuclease III
MRTENINGRKVELYDSILDMPARRYDDFNRATLIDAEIGSDLEAFSQRCATIQTLIKRDPDGAFEEVNNLRQSVTFTMSRVSTKDNAFAQLVKSIDGQVYPLALTDSDEAEIKAKLNTVGFTRRRANELLDAVKKKLTLRLKRLFRRSRKAEK